MKKILASILAITMLLTTLSTCVIPASAEDAAVATSDILFVEDFQGYGEGNWLSSMVEGKDIVDSSKVSGMKDSEWTIYGGQYRDAYYTAEELINQGASVEVVADPADANNKVLKIAAGDLANQGWVRVRRNANGESKIARKDIPGKTMIIKANFKVPTGFNISGDTAAFTYDRNAKVKGLWMAGTSGAPMANYGGREWPMLSIDAATYQSNYNTKATQYVDADKWFEVKYVIDMTEHKTENHPADTYRGFYNGSVYYAQMRTYAETNKNKNVLNSKFPQPAAEVGGLSEKVYDSWGGYAATPTDTTFVDFGDFYGATMTVSGYTGGANDYLYMDNLQVYYVDDFKQEGTATYEKADNGIWYAGEIRIPFNNDLMTEVKENNKAVDYTSIFTLKDAEGNVVEGGITRAYADGNELVIVPSKEIARNTSYTVVASPLFMDAEGQGLNQFSKAQDVYTFATVEDPYAHIIYDIDFDSEDLETGVNWIDNKDSNRYVTVKGLELGAVTINQDPDAGAHKVEVVADPDPSNSGNKVLALTSAGTNGKVTKVRFNANGKDGIARSTMGKGKKLVYKVKIFLPAGYRGTESSALVNPSSETNYGANSVSGIGATIRTGETFYAATLGTWGTVMARSSTQSWEKPYETKGKWLEWKHVADVSKPLSPSHSDTVRAYVDNRLVASEVVNSENPSTSFTANDKYSVVLGDTVIDYLANASKTDVLANGGSASIGATWWGSHFTINPPSNAGDATYTYYLDDAEAYWIDALTMKDINANEYNGGKVVLEFNQRIREEVEYFVGKEVNNTNYRKLTLAELFNIVDETGAVVEDGIAEVSISADGKKVYITPSDKLAKGVNYKIEVSPYLIDEYGQGLENNSKATYVDLKISENYVPFTVELSRDEINGFDSGRDNVKVTAKFSVAVDAENIENNIVVTNKATGAVATGWTYEFGTTEDGETDYTTVIFDFAGLEKADYTVKSTDDFAAVNAANLANALEITIKAAAGPIVLFDETFETGYAEGNLITEDKLSTAIPTNKSFRNYTIPSVDGKGNWDVQLYVKAGTANTLTGFTDFFGVVDAPEGMGTGKVLKVANTRSTAYLTDYMSFRRNFDDERNPYRFDEGEYAGKVLVYEADVYSPSVKADTPFMQPSINKTSLATYNEGIWKVTTNSSGSLSVSGGSYNSDFAKVGHGASWFRNNYLPGFKTATRKVRFVIDQATERDTMRLYVDGAMHTTPASQVAQLIGHPMNDPEGRYDFGPAIENTHMDNADQEWNMNTAKNLGNSSSIGDNKGVYGVYSVVSGAGTDANTEVVYYYDNFKAYLVDAFEIEEVTGYGNNYNTEKGRITYTFSKKVDMDTAIANKNIVVLDKDGNEVAGGIDSITAKDGGYQLEIKLSETLAHQTGYTVWIKAGLRDTDGLSLRTQYSYYLYDIDAHYEKVAGTDNVYSITSVAGKGPMEATYTERVIEDGKVVKPAYLTYAGNYKAATDMYVKDYAKMKSKIGIVTSKSNSLSAEATPAVIEDGKVTTKVVFSNPEVNPMKVWCVIAAFGEFNEMLGKAIVDVNEIEASTLTDEIEVSFTTKAGKTVKSVRMFVWDSYEDMNVYQKAENIWE